ncbi:MAG: endonuclease MutS2 [Lachnospira sp.]|nr:endonuclease MutS2 [Lachnospira sp.]
MNRKSLSTLEYNKIIDKLQSFAVSRDAKNKAAKLVPMTDIDKINVCLTETGDAVSRLYAKGCASFSGVSDVMGSVKRLEVGSCLNAHELLQISGVLSAAKAHKTHYEETQDSLTPLYDSLDPVPSLYAQIKKCIISEDEISDDASANLKDIRRNIRLANDRIHTELNKILNNQALRNCLQDYVITSRQGRYCLPVKAEYKSQVPGMVHDQSATGSTIFIEPAAVVKLNNDIRELELKEEAEIQVILADLSAQAAEYTEQIATDYKVLVKLDFIFAKAQLARNWHCTAPVMNTEHYTNIKQGRHPLIDPEKVVPIDINLGKDFNLLIITGPNTGGKTVSLKTVGLLTLMAQAGLYIPALDHSQIGIFNNIFADIGDEQSIEQSLSTFSSHMTNTIHILKNATSDSLILFDEIGAGTDPTEGAALAISILNDLHQRGITTMATTHYSEIKIYALTTPGVENACCEFDVASLKPTYRLLIGVPGKSNAFAISKRLGLPEYLIDDAARRMDAEDIHFEDIISDLETSRATIRKEQEEITRYKKEITDLKAELKAKQQRLDERTDKIIKKANQEAAEILKEAKEYADETIKTMNKHGLSVKELEKQRTAVRDKINKSQEKLAVKAATPKAHKASDISEFKEGIYVRILSMNLTGTVVGTPNTKGEVTVAVGSLTTKAKINNLEIITDYKEPEESKSGKSSTGQGRIKMSKSASISPEINLLGCTVDEAVAKLDKYLDNAYISKLSQVRIVHGKGTGALRAGITAYLKGIPYIKNFRLGEAGEGDAGVTIVEFK